jgi:hypothetical protein
MRCATIELKLENPQSSYELLKLTYGGILLDDLRFKVTRSRV